MTNASKTASPRKTSAVRQHGIAVLLGLAFLLQGAKTEIAFAFWGVAALAYATWIIITNAQPVSLHDEWDAFIFLAGIALVSVFSVDRTTSFFWSLQWMTFTLLWIALRTGVTDAQSGTSLLPVLRISGFLTAVLTIGQLSHGIAAWGWLPVNTDWNGAWMAVLSIFLVSNSLETSRNRFWKYADAALAILLILLIMMSPSRSALLGLVIGLIVLAQGRYPWSWKSWTLILGGALLAFLPSPWFQSRLHHTLGEIHQGGRLIIWRIALHALLDHPLLGYGPGNFELAYLKHALPVIQNPVQYDLTTAFAHNEFLQLLIECGWPLGGWLLLGIFHMFRTHGMRSRTHLTEKAALAALGITALFNPTFHLPLLLLTAILLTSRILSKPASPALTFRPDAWLKAGLLCIIFFIATGLAWRGLRSLWAHQQRWDRIVAISPSDADAWHELGQHGSASENINAQERAVQESPNRPYFQEALGETLESTGRTDDTARALQAYLDATLEAPKRAVNYLAIGRLLLREDDPAAALPWFEKAQALEPFYWEADLWMARCQFALGERQKALQILQSLEPRHEEFLRHFPPTDYLSPYEQVILGYDSSVVSRQQRWFLDKMRHS